MATSIVGGLVNQGTDAGLISVHDSSAEQLEKIAQRFGVRTSKSNTHGLAEADIVVLCIKPDIVPTVCQEIGPALNDATLLISVAAGVRCANIASWTDSENPLVRCMPNTPALLGLGATALFADSACTDQHRSAAENLLQATGTVRWVPAESDLDAVTALSGSGPAYFFYMIECMTEAATAMGLDPEVAQTLALETAFGAASMARLREHSPTRLRENVTSKGGTTQAALESMASDGFAETISRAMAAARARSQELGEQ